jgi:hypothetical protein
MIVVPAWAWKATLDVFAEAWGSLEPVAYLDGVAGGQRPLEGGVVTTVTFPRALGGARGNVTTADTTLAALHLEPHELVRLVQIHTQPPTGTDLCETDDERTFPPELGAVSIVIPHHGLTWPGLGEADVHVLERRGWRQVDSDEIQDYVCVVPSRIDLRAAHSPLHL